MFASNFPVIVWRCLLQLVFITQPTKTCLIKAFLDVNLLKPVLCMRGFI